MAHDDAEKVSIEQEITLRSTDCLRRIIAPVGGQGGVTTSYLCPHCNSFLLEDSFGGSLGEEGVQLVVRDLWREIRLEATKQALGGANRRKC